MTGNQSESQAQYPAPQQVAPLLLQIHRIAWESFRIPLQAEFRFDPEDPLVVTVTFRQDGAPPVTWHISRELLYNGLLEAQGDGDVRVRPTQFNSHWMVRMRLESRGTRALLEADLHRLEEWLEDTYTLVPLNEELEGVDWDALAAKLLEEP